MAKYRKKPVVIEAFRWGYDKVPNWWIDRSENFKMDTATGAVIIPTLEGNMTAERGDWIIQGVKGELYPCKPDIFDATYTEVKDEPL